VNKPVEIAPDTVAACPGADDLAALVRKYDPTVDTDLICRAYEFAKIAHGSQMRHSGEPYYTHPVEVATILAGLHLDVQSICTALLHDVVEDTDANPEQIVEMFGQEIADLVGGVTKLGQVEFSSSDIAKRRHQAENFQKFIIAVSRDIRVLLVKLCDRLHNMRTLHYHPKIDSRERISRETLEVYAPLARRIGVDHICSELENLAFKHLDPAQYETITRRLDTWRSDQHTAISRMSVALRDLMDKYQIPVRIYGREKLPYAIWRKLQQRGITFEDVADIYAFRIIVQKPAACYRVLGILHQNYRFVAGRFRDFISVPKPNGYQSLHTTISGPGSKRLEIQVRTERMEDVAERGVAAHWAYKNRSYAYDMGRAHQDVDDPLARIRPLVEMMEQSRDADEFLEHVKLEMFTDQVFTFTPKGDLISLPRGATALDFAYSVHTDIGDTCVGAIINDRKRPLRTELQNGDVIKIIRGGKAEPQPGWENIVTTGKARSALRRLTRQNEVEEFHRIGRVLAEHALVRENVNFAESSLTDALKRLDLNSTDDLYVALGRGDLLIQDFMKAVFPGRESTRAIEDYAGRDLISDSTAELYVKGDGLTSGVSLHLGDCCSPVPGDRIVGIQSPGRGVVIHTIDCDGLSALENQSGWLNIGWRRSADQAAATARLTATIEHVPGALADVTRIIGEAGGNLVNVNTTSRSPTFCDMIVGIEVRDIRHLMQIIAALRTSVYVVSATRTRPDHED